MPISHLNQEPNMRVIIEDITCDSDGIITNYMNYQGNEPSLKVPPYDPNNPYLLAVFMVGAYQEIMGNMHNLFGRVTTVDILLDGKNDYIISDIYEGFTNKNSLEHVGYNVVEMLDGFKKNIAGLKISKAEQLNLLNQLTAIFNSHTYLT